jgi:hypothetical protein
MIINKINNSGSLNKLNINSENLLDTAVNIFHNNQEYGISIQSVAEINRSANIRFLSVGNTIESPTVIQQNNNLGQISFAGYVDSPIGETSLDLVSVTSEYAVLGDNTTIPRGKFVVNILNGPNPADSDTMKFEPTGELTAPAIMPGVYADATARDAKLIIPKEGMMVFLQDIQKFSGYVSDVGLATSGVSNGTPGWIDLN